MIRSIRSTDLVKLPFLKLNTLSNEAMPRSRIGRGDEASLIRLFPLGQWLPLEKRRRTWIWIQGRHIKGLISARSRKGFSAWEVDYLLLPGDDGQFIMEVLEGLCITVGQQGVDKLFLRLPAKSPVLDVVQEAGFCCYTREYLYRFNGEGLRGPKSSSHGGNLRRRAKSDEHALFQLHCATSPLPVRQVEGLTLQEWRESRERGWGKGRAKESVYEKDGRLLGWLGISTYSRTGQFDVLADMRDPEVLPALLNLASTRLQKKSSVLCLVPEFQEPLGRLLMELNFEETEQYLALMKHITAKIREPSLAPLGVSQ